MVLKLVYFEAVAVAMRVAANVYFMIVGLMGSNRTLLIENWERGGFVVKGYEERVSQVIFVSYLLSY